MKIAILNDDGVEVVLLGGDALEDAKTLILKRALLSGIKNIVRLRDLRYYLYNETVAIRISKGVMDIWQPIPKHCHECTSVLTAIRNKENERYSYTAHSIILVSLFIIYALTVLYSILNDIKNVYF